MIRSARLLTAPLAFALLLTAWLPAPVEAASPRTVQRPLKVVIGAIRQERDALALKQFAGEQQGAFLLEDAWTKATPAQKKQFMTDFHALFSEIAFPKVRENFEHLDSVRYGAPEVDGKKAKVASTLLINHPLKKQELQLQYEVVKVGTQWKVLDVTVMGSSMLTDIRNEQIRPIMKDGGMDRLLELMKAKVAQVKAARANR